MTAANRDRWLDLLWEVEGGFSNHPQDNGGATKYGVTQDTLSRWRNKPEVTVEDVQLLTKEEARDIALARYWNPIKADDLPGGLDIYAADTAYHSGPRRAAQLLQGCLGIEVDGYVGPKTLQACRAELDTAKLIKALHDKRMAFLRDLPDYKHFAAGWANRCVTVLGDSLPLVRANVVEARVPTAIVEGGITAVTVAAIVELLPSLIQSGQQGYDAVGSGQWAVVATAVATVVGMAVRGIARFRAHQAGGAA